MECAVTPVARRSDHVLQVSGELDVATVAVGRASAEAPQALPAP